ncbi:MAG: hypothetical protein WCX69_01980, partial [Candidatus Paceibacterota bacterium]
YSDASTKVEAITTANITGFDSAAPAIGQILTITVGGKTATYVVNIIATPIIVPVASGGGGGGGTSVTANKIAPQVKGASTTASDGVQKPIDQMTRVEKLEKIAEIKLLLIQLIGQLIIELQKQLLAAGR